MYIVSVLSTFVNGIINDLDGLTYAQLAKTANIAESTIKCFMCGASDSRRVAEKIANSLGYALQYENGIYTLVNKEETE